MPNRPPDRPTLPPPPPPKDPHERPTLVPCFVCDGNFTTVVEHERGRYSTRRCPWCTEGFMSTEEARTWLKSSAAQRLAGKLPPKGSP